VGGDGAHLCLFGPILNVIVWPLVLLLLLTCFALAVSLLLGGLGAGLLVPPALYFSDDIERVLELVCRLPGYGVYMPSPPWWWVGLFYVALVVWVARRLWPQPCCWPQAISPITSPRRHTAASD